MPDRTDVPGTRERLLQAAALVFAEHGYHQARIRAICERAGANIAAVNYHFGDKKRLYQASLRYAFFALSGSDPTDWGIVPKASIDQQLEGFARTILTQLLSPGDAAMYPQLVARELSDPTGSLDEIVNEGIRPQVELLLGGVRQLLGPRAEEATVRRCLASILGQCIFYYFARPVMRQLSLEEDPTPENIAAIAAHIVRFSLAGIRDAR